MVIAGYDVLADEIPAHRDYVRASFERAIDERVNLVFVVGGVTNPDYPHRTEAEANHRIIQEIEGESRIKGRILGIQVEKVPIGNTSAETIEAVRHILVSKKIPVDKIVLCTEKARHAGFSVDDLYTGLSEYAEGAVVTYGHPFPDSKKDFTSQRRKMLMKVLSHYGFPFNVIRRIYQKFHQIRVARIKRRQAKTPRKS